jgi:hypothetical protein
MLWNERDTYIATSISANVSVAVGGLTTSAEMSLDAVDTWIAQLSLVTTAISFLRARDAEL